MTKNDKDRLFLIGYYTGMGLIALTGMIAVGSFYLLGVIG